MMYDMKDTMKNLTMYLGKLFAEKETNVLYELEGLENTWKMDVINSYFYSHVSDHNIALKCAMLSEELGFDKAQYSQSYWQQKQLAELTNKVCGINIPQEPKKEEPKKDSAPAKEKPAKPKRSTTVSSSSSSSFGCGSDYDNIGCGRSYRYTPSFGCGDSSRSSSFGC